MNFLNHFEQVSIINLPERTDRKQETLQEFSRAGWDIDGTRVSFFPALRPETPDGFPTCGVRGCFLSHMEVLRKARENRAATVLIMEDDIAFTRDIDEIGTTVMAELDGIEWGFIYFGHDRPVKTNIPRVEQISEPLLLAHFYAINGSCLERFLPFLEEILKRPAGHPDGGPMHYDGAISTFRIQNPDIPTYIVYPSLASQRSSRTDLHALSIFDRWSLLAPLTTTLRRAKNALKRVLS